MTEQISQQVKQAVVKSAKFPAKDELEFLEKQPGTQLLVKQVNQQLVGLMSDLATFIMGKSTLNKNQLTLPFKNIEPIMDELVERAGIQLDKLEFGDDDDEFQEVAAKNKKKEEQQKVELPPKAPDVYGFRDAIDLNSKHYPFIPVIRHKTHAKNPMPPEILEAQENREVFFKRLEGQGLDLDVYEFPHPYEEEITDFEIPREVADPQEEIKTFTNLGQPIMVTTVEELRAMIAEIVELVEKNGRTEIALDLEHHSQHSYMGITCLIQLTTRANKDYIIDPFFLWKDLPELGVILHDPRVIKVLHGADSDVVWLQRDFGLYLVGLFDTYQAAKQLYLPSFAFAYLLEYYCNRKTDKQYQTADWSQRPLSKDMLKYAQMDTHYLLYIYDRARIDLYNLAIRRGVQPPSAFIVSTVNNSKTTALKVFRKTPGRADLILDNILLRAQQTLDPKRYEITVKMLELREKIARENDENPKFMLPNHHLFRIIDAKPTKPSDIYKVTGGERNTHVLVKQYASEFVRLCLSEQIAEVVQPKPRVLPPPIVVAPLVASVQVENVAPVHFDYVPMDVEITTYENQLQTLVLNAVEKQNSKLLEQINQSFTFGNSLEAYQNTEIGQILIQNILNKENMIEEKGQSSMQNGQQPIQQQASETQDFIAFPKEEGEKSKQKPTSYRLFDDQEPKSLKEQYGTTISGRKRVSKLQEGSGLRKRNSSNFNVLK